MKPENWTAEGEIAGILLCLLFVVVLWAIGALWAYYNAEKARRLVREVESRKARAREHVQQREREGGYGHARCPRSNAVAAIRRQDASRRRPARR